MEYILKTQGITKIYGKNKVVDDVCMMVPKGAIYGFIGKNGAGKTTFMRIVAGLAIPTAGSVELFGDWDNLSQNRNRLGTLIENPGVYDALSARENMEIVRRTFGIRDKDKIGGSLSFVGLDDTGKKKVKDFSMGMKQRLGIAIALFRDPEFLILDEPINGLDPEGIKEVRELLVKLNKEKGITIMISSHILGELSKIATHYGIIRSGQLIEQFSADELDQKCRGCQKLYVSDLKRSENILREKLNISDYDTQGDNTIRIFQNSYSPEQINRELIIGGVDIRESCLTGENLEEYFMELLGGQV